MTILKLREASMALLGGGVLVWSGVAGAQGTLTITPTYLNGAGEIWTTERIAVFERAISDWESVLGAPASEGSVNIDVTVDFTNAGSGGYLGQWSGSWEGVFAGDSTRPWSKTSHIIHFNADQFPTDQDNYSWWDPTPETAGDQPFQSWDLLSVARHEIGHMLGFTGSLYRDGIGTGSEVNLWQTHIEKIGNAAIFDDGGLTVTMASTSNIGHVADSGVSTGDLMTADLPNGQRRGISQLDLDMLALAYNYQLIPEPGITWTLVLSLGVAVVRRRRS